MIDIQDTGAMLDESRGAETDGSESDEVMTVVLGSNEPSLVNVLRAIKLLKLQYEEKFKKVWA